MGELLSAAAWTRHFALIFFFPYCFFQSTLPGLNHKKQMSHWCETDLTSLFCMFKCPTGWAKDSTSGQFPPCSLSEAPHSYKETLAQAHYAMASPRVPFQSWKSLPAEKHQLFNTGNC